ncbi:MAG TPA: hypothetical protein PLY34_06855 [Ferruginibacter sp.]|nr:hypothetical protein [Ferruginibacter sp.]HPH91248.1 hypothetical protein [Ferruginibacter sp.]
MKKAILKTAVKMMINNKGTCKYHCNKMPMIKGMSSLIMGAVFHIGMFKGFDTPTS